MRHMKNLKRIIPVMSSSREAKCEFFYPARLHYPGGEVFYIYRISSGGVPTTIRPPGVQRGVPHPHPRRGRGPGAGRTADLLPCPGRRGGGPVLIYYFPLLVGPSQLLLCSLQITGILCINHTEFCINRDHSA